MSSEAKVAKRILKEAATGKRVHWRAVRDSFPEGRRLCRSVLDRLASAGVLKVDLRHNGTPLIWRLAPHLERKVEKRKRIQRRGTRSGTPNTAAFGAEVRGARASGTPITVATSTVARDGMVLEVDGLDLEPYRKNPVVLWEHGEDPTRGARPIARAKTLKKRNGDLKATLEFAGDDFAQDIKRKYENGFLNAASVGWITLNSDQRADPPRITESEMTEFSLVAVPADADALSHEHATAQVQ
jgi:hypothetical protein